MEPERKGKTENLLPGAELPQESAGRGRGGRGLKAAGPQTGTILRDATSPVQAPARPSGKPSELAGAPAKSLERPREPRPGRHDR